MLNMKSKIFKYIYAMLCLLPAIAVGVTCVYVANNENAYQSYSGSTSSTSLVNAEVLVEGNTYHFDMPSVYSGDGEFDLYFDGAISNLVTELSPSTSSISRYQISGSSSYYYLSNDTILYNSFVGSFDFVYSSGEYSALLPFIYEEVSNPYYYLDNVFYYSLDKVENSSVFSWVKSNFLYDGMNSFVGIFGGTNSNISFYLTWVLTISLCYLGFEVLMLFINMARNLIHSFTDKDRW